MLTALRRPPVTIAAVLVSLAIALAAFSLRPGPAGAQVDAGDVILDASVVIDPDVNGFATLAGGSSDLGIDSVVCSGSNPQGGVSQIPAQVMCQLLSTSVRIRVKNHVGASVTAPVRVVVFYDIRPEQGTMARARAALEHPRQIG